MPLDFSTIESDPDLFSMESWNSLVLIAMGVLNFKLYNYQIEILRHVAAYDRVAVVASRQLGKSVCIAVLALTWALSHPESTVLIVSTGERQAKELLTKRNYSIKKIFNRQGRENIIHYDPNFNANPQEMLTEVAKLKGLNLNWQEVKPKYDSPDVQLNFEFKNSNAEEAELFNGSRIIAVPASPDTISGFTIDLLIGDEIAKMPAWEEMWGALQPMVTRGNNGKGGKIALFSSFKGTNHWWEICTKKKKSLDNPLGWEVLKYPITVNPPVNLEQLKADLDPDVFAEEFMCEPVSNAHSLFSYDLIDKCSRGQFLSWG